MSEKLITLGKKLAKYEPVGTIDPPKSLKFALQQDSFLKSLERLHAAICAHEQALKSDSVLLSEIPNEKNNEIMLLIGELRQYKVFADTKYVKNICDCVIPKIASNDFNEIITEISDYIEAEEYKNLSDLDKLIALLLTYKPFGTLSHPMCFGFILDFEDFVNILIKINRLIGMETIKTHIVDSIWSWMINYRIYGKPTHKELLHTCFLGPPGCGKTTIGQLLAQLWTCSGCINNNGGNPLYKTDADKNQPVNGNPSFVVIRQPDDKSKALSSSLFLRETQLREATAQLTSTRTNAAKLLTTVNNLRKKVKAKEGQSEEFCQARFQEIKTSLKAMTGTSSTTGGTAIPLGFTGGNVKILPVTVPKVGEERSMFGAEKFRLTERLVNTMVAANLANSAAGTTPGAVASANTTGAIPPVKPFGPRTPTPAPEIPTQPTQNTPTTNEIKLDPKVEFIIEKAASTELVKAAVTEHTLLRTSKPDPLGLMTFENVKNGLTKYQEIANVQNAKPIKTVAKFSVLTRGDFVGKFQGHSTANTRRIINEHVGATIMIDEAYTLCTGPHDDFGKETLTEIINCMTQFPENVVFIFNGYLDQMQETIYKFQPGLERRFENTCEIGEYSAKQICQIFVLQLSVYGWELENPKEILKFFEEKKDDFPHFGGSTQKLCKDVKEELYKSYRLLSVDDSIPNDVFVGNMKCIPTKIVLRAFEKFVKKSATLVKDKKQKIEDKRIIESYFH